MISRSAQVVLGLLLSGCTVNTYHTTKFEPRLRTETTITRDVFLGVAGIEEKQTVKVPEPAVTGNAHIRPECGVYQPLPVPEPVRIDFKQLDAAPTAKDINEIALSNIKALNEQLTTYSKNQKKHYADYVKRCVVK